MERKEFWKKEFGGVRAEHSNRFQGGRGEPRISRGLGRNGPRWEGAGGAPYRCSGRVLASQSLAQESPHGSPRMHLKGNSPFPSRLGVWTTSPSPAPVWHYLLFVLNGKPRIFVKMVTHFPPKTPRRFQPPSSPLSVATTFTICLFTIWVGREWAPCWHQAVSPRGPGWGAPCRETSSSRWQGHVHPIQAQRNPWVGGGDPGSSGLRGHWTGCGFTGGWASHALNC